MPAPLIATLESGGTKMVAALASGPDEIEVRKKIPTTNPAETISRLISFFEEAQKQIGPAAALSIGTFGPADLDPTSSTYGWITSTPKPGWSQTDLLGPLQDALQVPAVFETDVNAALYGEAKWGAARGLEHAAYLTVGTGIGGGLIWQRQLVHGHGHPEMGHMRITPHSNDDFRGTCPFHGNCLEGLASGTALSARWGQADELPDDHPAWEMEADYLAQACLNLLMVAAPDRIILGGGVMNRDFLFPMIRERLLTQLGGYLDDWNEEGQLKELVTPPGLGEASGLLGCVALGQALLRDDAGNSRICS